MILFCQKARFVLRAAKQPAGRVFIIERWRGKGCDACFSMLNVKGRMETLVVEDCMDCQYVLCATVEERVAGLCARVHVCVRCGEGMLLNIFFLVVCGTDKLHLASGQTKGQAAAGWVCI